MTIKCSGAEFKRFYEDATFWIGRTADEHTWHEDAVITVNGCDSEAQDLDLTAVNDADKLTIEGGVVFGPVVGSKEPSMEGYFKRWKKAQSVQTLVIECDSALVEKLKTLIKEAGGKVL